LPGWKDDMAGEVFASLVKIKVRRGDIVFFFWQDRWLNGVCVEDIVPVVFNAVTLRRRRKRKVEEALEMDH
jgi:hypothetical protein